MCIQTSLEKNFFDLVVSFNTLHNLYNFKLFNALKEISRVKKKILIYVWNHIETKKKSKIFYIGKLRVKVFILLQNGNGGLN